MMMVVMWYLEGIVRLKGGIGVFIEVLVKLV